MIGTFITYKAAQYFLHDMNTSDLNMTRDLLVNFLQRGRMTSQTQSQFMGIEFSSDRAVLYIDTDHDGVLDGTETTLGDIRFRGNVVLLSGCGDNALDLTNNKTVTFNSLGFVGVVSGSNFVKKSWQVFVQNPKLDPGTRAREIEALSSGLIEKIPTGQSGFVTDNPKQANLGGQDCATP